MISFDDYKIKTYLNTSYTINYMGWLTEYKEFNKAILKNKKINLKKVMISPTDSCNLRCKICWRLEKKENPNAWKDKELSFDRIKCLLQDCKKLGVKIIDLTGGGEAFCRSDIFNIIKLAKDSGFFVTMTSNGTLLTKEKIKELIDLHLDDICFSLESYDENINDYIRGSGVCKKVVKTIGIFNELKEKKNLQKPIIRIASVITKKNYKKLDSLIEFCKEQNIQGINFSVLMEWKTNKELSMKNEKYNEVLLRLSKKLDKEKIYHNLRSIIKYGLFEHSLPEFCFSPWEMVFINSQGDVLACCTLASLYENVLGNIQDQRFIDILCATKMQDFKERMKKKEFFKDCNKCLPEITEIYNRLHDKIKS